MLPFAVAIAATLIPSKAPASKPRARALGVPFSGTPGPLNAITDVRGVEVGMVTLSSGKGPLVRGKGPVRTGVTAILPLGKKALSERVAGGWFAMNGNGEMTGTTWLTESGLLEGPVMITNTHSVGVVRDALVEWGVKHFPGAETFSLGVVAETWDGYLNDIDGFHVKKEHVFQALDGAKSGPVEEGNVGGGTGMIVCEFKGGTGTSSRVVKIAGADFVVGVLVQANYGARGELKIAGLPIGEEITDLMPKIREEEQKDGSIIVVIATDAPLLPHQMQRVVKRAALGLGRTGSTARDSSGDIFVAFTNARPVKDGRGLEQWTAIPNPWLNPIFKAAVEATEEAIANALVAAETMTGIDDNVVYALPHDRLRAVLEKYGRLAK